MHTAAVLSPLPEPRRMAVRPVSWIARMMAEGAAVPVVVTRLEVRDISVFWRPGRGERAVWRAWMQESQVRGTEKVAV